MKDGLPVEAHITAGLNHVNVVRTIAHAWRPLSAHVTAGMSVWDSADSAAGIASEGETWLLLELCDRGTLQVRACCGFRGLFQGSGFFPLRPRARPGCCSSCATAPCCRRAHARLWSRCLPSF